MTEVRYMEVAIQEAEIALEQGNWPIGSVIELGGEIISRTHNLVYSTGNRFAHAEMLGLQAVNQVLSDNPNEATLYTTYEPCPMCFGACILGRIKKWSAALI